MLSDIATNACVSARPGIVDNDVTGETEHGEISTGVSQVITSVQESEGNLAEDVTAASWRGNSPEGKCVGRCEETQSLVISMFLFSLFYLYSSAIVVSGEPLGREGAEMPILSITATVMR